MASNRKVDAGFIGTIAVAVIVTVWDAWFFLLSAYTVPPVWAWMQLVVVAGAWGAVAAWSQGRWGLAGLGLLLTIGGVWGYFYIPPMVAVLLAGMAFARALSQSRGRTAASSR